jgi:Zn-dependent peptidase ImmA (M78 family)
MEDALEHLAQKYLQGVECPPTDLESIGARVGITGFECADIPGSGELRKDGKGLRVFYSHHLSPERTRFTIAHEIGHAVLEQTGPHAPRTGRELERLCDMFAAALLMPKNVFVENAHGEVSTQRILDMARHFRTSVATTGIRYAELCGVSVFAYQDSRVIWGKGIGPTRQTSVDESLRPAIRKALDGDVSCDEIFLSSSESFRRWHFECRPLEKGKSVLCLLRPARERSSSSAPVMAAGPRVFPSFQAD